MCINEILHNTISLLYKGPFVQRKFLTICLILAYIQVACSPVSSNTELDTTPPPSVTRTNTLTPAPTALPTQVPEPINTSTVTPVALQTLEPLVTSQSDGNSPFFDSWSLDSNWIAFWWVEFGGDTLPGSLAFVEVDSGKICLHPEVFTEEVGYGNVHWEANELARVVTFPSDQTFIGTPCETFIPADPLPQPTGEPSPDGQYLASTISGLQGPLFTYTTTVTELSTGQVITTIPWTFSPNDAQGGGPQWLNNQIYLIGPAINQGFLYLDVTDSKVRKVVTDLLGLDTEYVEQYRSIFSQVDPITGAYHLLLKWEGGPTPLPMLLYHSESNQLETLPFYSAWPFNSPGEPGFSLDGQWLLLGDPVGDEPFLEKIGGDYWLRPVDPPDSEAMQLSEETFPAGLSIEGQKIAFSDGKTLDILGFPSGEFLSRWKALNYDFQIHTLKWAPNGRYLVISGSNESNQTVLFVLEP